MINITSKEFIEGDKAVKVIFITFFGLVLYSCKMETSNINIIKVLTPSRTVTVKGFNNEN